MADLEGTKYCFYPDRRSRLAYELSGVYAAYSETHRRSRDYILKSLLHQCSVLSLEGHDMDGTQPSQHERD